MIRDIGSRNHKRTRQAVRGNMLGNLGTSQVELISPQQRIRTEKRREQVERLPGIQIRTRLPNRRQSVI
ncbi:MAG TPA: hypothetical protein VFG87_26920, partial [Amycolatopsis sp.]|nr:hypothetical protein [Amycolatopsis sp.]